MLSLFSLLVLVGIKLNRSLRVVEELENIRIDQWRLVYIRLKVQIELTGSAARTRFVLGHHSVVTQIFSKCVAYAKRADACI